MTDTNPDHYAADTPNRPSPFKGLRKIGYAFGLLFFVWLIFGEAVPRFMFPESQPQTGFKPVTNRSEPTPAAPQAQPATPAAHNDQQEQITALTSRIEQLEAKLKTFEEVVTALPQTQTHTTAETVPAVDEERVMRLEERVTGLQAAISNTTTESQNRITTLTAFSQLKDAALRGDGFAGQYTELSKLVTDNPEAQGLLKQLEPYAERGIATLPELQKQFDETVPLALGTGSSHSLVGNVQSLIIIRKVGEQPGNDDEAVLARAEAKLSRGDIEGTQKELSQLSPSAAAAVSGWVSEAQANVRTRALCDALQLSIIQPSAEIQVPAE